MFAKTVTAMIKVSLLLTHQFKLLSVAAILDVLETVNRFYTERSQAAPFAISLFHPAGTRQKDADSFFNYKLHSLRASLAPDLILIPSFTTNDMRQTLQRNQEAIPWLKKQFQSGAEIASFCTGAFLLGASGLLDKKIATTHVDASKAFASAFPAVDLRPDKTLTQDGRLYTSGGATSTFHLLLHLVQQHCGRDIAVRAAKVFAIDMDRDNQSYFSTFRPLRDHHDDLVATAQQKIEASYHDTGTIEEMIRDLPASRRNMVRRFKQVTGITPIEYLQQTRIEAAKKLLEQTSQQMTEVILNSGYNDPKAFRKIFRKTVGMTPSEYREKFQTR
jgi:transcriptional regulator GlxA family with amidase domain